MRAPWQKQGYGSLSSRSDEDEEAQRAKAKRHLEEAQNRAIVLARQQSSEPSWWSNFRRRNVSFGEETSRPRSGRSTVSRRRSLSDRSHGSSGERDRGRVLSERGASYGGGPLFPSTEEGEGYEMALSIDSSRSHLKKLFGALDTRKSGLLTYEELAQSLSNLGLYSDLGPVIQQMKKRKEKRGDAKAADTFTEEEFVSATQHHLLSVSAPSATGSATMFVVDYSQKHVRLTNIQTSPDIIPSAPFITLDAFLDDTIPTGSDGNSKALQDEKDDKGGTHTPVIRWITVTGIDKHLLLRLANKLDIHPLMLADALSPNKERLKVDKGRDGLMHILFGNVVLLDQSSQWWPDTLQKEMASVFFIENVKGRPDPPTVLFIQRSPGEINDRILNHLMYTGSKLRLNGPRFLVYALIDAMVDQVFPIMRAFHNWLVDLQSSLQRNGKTPLTVAKSVQMINREMHMLTFHLKPMKPVVSHLVEYLPEKDDYDDGELRRHLTDLLDHCITLEDQAQRMITWSKSLNDDFHNEQQYRQNQAMYLLAMVTTAFMPGEFFSSIFGMNFKYMPGLEWRYSYLLFWMVIMTLMLVVYRFYRKMKWV
ncbi:unnamed protein product [Chrysoparadoxa australica]